MQRVDYFERWSGAACWHVSAGGATAPSFMLVLGDKVPRAQPLQNPAQPECFRNHRGSIELLVWCSWRLQTTSSVLAASDLGTDWTEQLAKLVGQSVVTATCSPPAWDLRITFTGELELLVFCDHAAVTAPIAQNWELFLGGKIISAGPGSSWQVEPE